MKPIIIGVAGASGSGKTTVAKELLDHYGADKCTIISSDNYYKGLGSTPIEQRHEFNFDHPESIEFELLEQHLGLLKSNQSVHIPTYNFSISSRKEETVLIIPTRIIIVEGILVLHPQGMTDLFDIKIFVNAQSDLCFIRRLERDMKERGRAPAEVIAQYKKTVKPMYDEYVEPCKERAELVIENSNENHTKGLRFDMTQVTDLLDLAISGQKCSKQHRFMLFPRAVEGGLDSRASMVDQCSATSRSLSNN